MKRALPVWIAVVCLALMAGLASAYVQPGHLSQAPADTKPAVTSGQNVTPIPDVLNDPSCFRHPRGGFPPRPGDRPTNPVPEPGTMMLASMGLIALGASLRRRRR